MTKSKQKRITLKLLKKASENSFGNLSKIANNLGIGYLTLRKFLFDNPSAMVIVGIEREKLVDMCENKLNRMALTDEYSEQTQLKALNTVLNAKGKERGYSNSSLTLVQNNNYEILENLKKSVQDPEDHIMKILEIKKNEDNIPATAQSNRKNK